MQSRLQELARARATVILDLSSLQFIDSTGLQLLIVNFNDAPHHGWQLRIDPHLTSQVRDVFQLVGLEHIFWP
jgi:anti-anti-sigma factor